MMVFRKLDFLSILSILSIPTMIAVGIFASSTAFADPRHSNRDHGFSSNNWSSNNWTSNNRASNNRFNRGFNRTFDRNFNHRYKSTYNRSNSRFDRSNFSSRYRSFNNNYYSGRSRNNGFSLNLNIGNTPYRSGYNFYTNTFLNPSWNYYSPLSTHTRVIYSQPSVVYVNDSRPPPVRVIKNTSYNTTTAANSGRSLLKDLHGNCFERSYDNYGRETRVQLPDAACNY